MGLLSRRWKQVEGEEKCVCVSLYTYTKYIESRVSKKVGGSEANLLTELQAQRVRE